MVAWIDTLSAKATYLATDLVALKNVDVPFAVVAAGADGVLSVWIQQDDICISARLDDPLLGVQVENLGSCCARDFHKSGWGGQSCSATGTAYCQEIHARKPFQGLSFAMLALLDHERDQRADADIFAE